MPTYTATASSTGTVAGSFTPYIAVVHTATASSTGSGSTTLTPVRVMALSISASGTVNLAMTYAKVTSNSMSSSASASSSASVAATFYATMISQVIAASRTAPEGAVFTWVMNAKTKAFSSYENYDFQSFLVHNGEHYGVAHDGIYKLSGNLDDGSEIMSFVILGTDDFKTHEMKHCPFVYLGGKSVEDLLLSVTIDDETVYTYGVPKPDGLGNTRAILGKGLRSRYWTFAISNPNGGSFEIDSIGIDVSESQRRRLNG